MSGATPDKLSQLSGPTPEHEIKHRPAPGRSGKQLDYIDARYVMDTLDTIVGRENWQDEYRPDVRSQDGIVCRLGIRLDTGEWVWKEDVGTESNIEGTKGSYSDAFKRAAVKWGVARDLYDEDRAATVQAAVAQTQVNQQQKAARIEREQSGEPRSWAIDPADAPWVCPEHEGVVVWPAGTSAAGRKYPAFYACPEGRDCPHRAPRGLSVDPKHLTPPKVDGQDDLPF